MDFVGYWEESHHMEPVNTELVDVILRAKSTIYYNNEKCESPVTL